MPKTFYEVILDDCDGHVLVLHIHSDGSHTVSTRKPKSLQIRDMLRFWDPDQDKEAPDFVQEWFKEKLAKLPRNKEVPDITATEFFEEVRDELDMKDGTRREKVLQHLRDRILQDEFDTETDRLIREMRDQGLTTDIIPLLEQALGRTSAGTPTSKFFEHLIDKLQ